MIDLDIVNKENSYNKNKIHQFKMLSLLEEKHDRKTVLQL